MTLWCIKGGSSGEREGRCISNSVIAIGWEELRSLSSISDRDVLRNVYEQTYPDSVAGRAANQIGQIWTFLTRIAKDDLVAMPMKTNAAVAIGRVKSDYQFRSDLGEDMTHVREVEWLRTDIPRTKFDADLLFSLGNQLTVCQIARNNAERRVQALVAGQSDTTVGPDEVTAEDSIDIERLAQDEIVKFIAMKFKGHNLARLVDGVLRAQGYTTFVSPPGPDGGVDILAGSGPFGFDSPRLCVQVKSSDSSLDLPVYNSLVGVMGSHGADQGLIVSWGGFKSTVEREAHRAFFKVRLWDSDRLVEMLLDNYEELSSDLRAEIPLKKGWALARQDGEA